MLFWKRLISIIVGIDYRDPNLNKSDPFVVYSLQAIEYFQDFLAYKLQYPQNTSVIIPVMCGKQGKMHYHNLKFLSYSKFSNNSNYLILK